MVVPHRTQQVYLDSMDIFLADLDPDTRRAKLEVFDGAMTRDDTSANDAMLGKMDYINPEERQKFLFFVRATDNLKTNDMREPDSVGCSLSLLFNAMNILYIIDEDEVDKRRMKLMEAAVKVKAGEEEGEAAEEEGKAAAAAEEEGKDDAGAVKGGCGRGTEEGPRLLTREQVRERSAESERKSRDLRQKLDTPTYFRGTFQKLLGLWKELEGEHFVEENVSSAKLKKEFEEGPLSGGLGIDLSLFGVKPPEEEVGQLEFNFGFNTELQVEKGKGDFNNTAEPILNRLDEVFSSLADTQKNAMWFSSFRRGLTMMGKSFDMKGASEQFKTALEFQRKQDTKIKAFVDKSHDWNVLVSTYEPTKCVQRRRELNMVAIEQAWEQRKEGILQGLVEMANDTEVVGGGGAFDGVDGGDGGKGEGEAEAELEEGMEASTHVHEPDKIVVSLKYSDEEYPLPAVQYGGQFKWVISHELGIPVSHQILRNADTDQIINDTEVLDNFKHVILERPVQRSVWCQFFIDTLVQDVDEDEVLRIWERLCRCTREGRNPKGGPEYSTVDEDDNPVHDGDQFLYAEDLRKLVQRFGQEPMNDEESVVFINECRPLTTKEMFVRQTKVGNFVMTQKEYDKPHNKNDLRPRVYYPWYYSALTDDAL